MPVNDQTTALEILKKGTQISGLNARNPDYLLAELTVQITGLMTHFKVAQTWGSPAEVRTAALTLAKDFWYMKLEDLKLCFDRAKRGCYGKVYNRLDLGLVYEWLRIYENTEKANAVERFNADMGKGVGLSDEDLRTLYFDPPKKREKKKPDNSEFNNFKMDYIKKKKQKLQHLADQGFAYHDRKSFKQGQKFIMYNESTDLEIPVTVEGLHRGRAILDDPHNHYADSVLLKPVI